jgi:hypothetical protein
MLQQIPSEQKANHWQVLMQFEFNAFGVDANCTRTSS